MNEAIEFTYGDIVYCLYDNLEIKILNREDYKFINNNFSHFTKDKDYALQFRNSFNYEEYDR